MSDLEKDIMHKPDNFSELICRYIIRGTLTNLTQLHVGSGAAETEFSIDNPLIRLKIGNDEVPYIPGSTLKGIFRTEIERFLKAQETNDIPSQREKICYPYDVKNKCNTGPIENICLACRIFGNNQIGSHFMVSDALVDMESFPGIKIKPGIAINRITGSTQTGALYDIETLQPGALFTFELQIINIDLKANNEVVNAIRFLLKELQEGWIQVGGRRSTGLGQIKLVDAEVFEITPETLIEFTDLAPKRLTNFLGEPQDLNFLCHDEFERIIRVTGSLKTVSRIHIGSGNTESSFEESDSLLIRIKKGELDLPYIPGSSLKGIFRSTIESILNSIGENVCFLREKSKCSKIGKKILNASRSRNYNILREEIEKFCLACKIFGGNNYSSNVSIADSAPLDSSSVTFDIAPGIAINRRDGTNMRGALFNLEHINPDSQFIFRMQINSLPNFLIGLLFKVIFLINKGIVLIGGKKRAGLGQVKIIIDKIQIRKPDSIEILDYNSLNKVILENFKIKKISTNSHNDFDINICLEDMKGKTRDEFSQLLISTIMEVWNKYVKNKKD